MTAWPKNPESRKNPAVIVSTVLLTGAITIFGLRAYAQLRYYRRLQLDGVFILFALLGTIGLKIGGLIALDKYGWERSLSQLQYDLMQSGGVASFAAILSFSFTVTCTRLSLLHSYYRIIPENGKLAKPLRYAHHTMAIYLVTLFVLSLIGAVTKCDTSNPDSDSGKPNDTSYCFFEGKYNVAVSGMDNLATALILLLPIPAFMQLRQRLPSQLQRASLLLFSLGIIVVGASIARTYWTWKGLIASHKPDQDSTWEAFAAWISASVEADIGLICAMAPGLHRLVYHSSFPVNGTGEANVRSKSAVDPLQLQNVGDLDLSTLESMIVSSCSTSPEVSKSILSITAQHNSTTPDIPSNPFASNANDWREMTRIGSIDQMKCLGTRRPLSASS